MNFSSLSINGTVYDDADGLVDGQIDGTGSNAGGLHVNLVNSAGNVVSSKAVNANGTYSFTEADGVQINTNFTLILTTASQTTGTPLSTASLASGWVSMGEDCCDNTGSDGTADSKLSVRVTTSSLNNANFGVNRTPTATPNSGTFTNPGGTNRVQVPTLAGTDPEDGALTSTMIISTLPTGGTLYYNGTPVTAGQTITGYDPAKLTFDPNDGITSAGFTFSVVDAAGVQSAPAPITMNFNTPTITINGNLSPFVTCEGTPSAEQTLSISGANLLSDVVVTAPDGYEVSLNAGSGFAPSITIARSANVINPTTIYIRLRSNAVHGISGNISAVSSYGNPTLFAIGAATVYGKPTSASAGADQVNCNNGSFSLAGNNPTVGTGVWSVVNGTAVIATPSSPTAGVTGIPAGSSATLRWTITNGTCPVSTDDVVLTNQLPPTTANAGADQALCNTSVFNMAANAPAFGTGRWTIVSGTATIVDDRSPTTSVSGIAPGATVTLRWSISAGICPASIDDVVLTNKGLATILSTTPAENCGAGSMTISATVSSGGIIQWYDAATGGNLLGTGSSFVTPVLSATTTYYAVAVLDGCASTRIPVTATVKPVPVTPTIAANGPLSFCQGSTVTLASSATSGNQWYRNGVLISGAVSQSYVASTAGTYHVVVSNAQGCSSAASAAQTVVVNPIPLAPSSISGLIQVTPGSSHTYTASPVAGATAYIWTLPSGWSGTSTTNTITVISGNTGGRISVRATANGCTSPAAFIDVAIKVEGEVLRVTKSASTPVLQSDGTYLMNFTITLRNLLSQPLTNVMVTDDLTRTFPSPIVFQVTSLKASGSLVVNQFYNGRILLDMLTVASTLPALSADSIVLTVRLEPNGYTGNIMNMADAQAASPLGMVKRQSIDVVRSGGRDTGPGVSTLTPILPVQLIIPTIFTPNRDGFNDKWVIVRPSGVRIKVQVYNRWGQVVYKSDDYRNDWDGRGTGSFLGKDLPHGSYFYLVDVDYGPTGQKEVRRGALMLKRDTY